MATANEKLRDAWLSHQVGVYRFGATLTRRVAAILNQTEAELEVEIRRRLRILAAGGVGIAFNRVEIARLKSLLETIAEIRGRAWDEIKADLTREFQDFAVAEAAFAGKLVTAVSPIILDMQSPAPATLRALVTARPFEGALLRDWMDDLAKRDVKLIDTRVKVGMAQGQSIDEIVRAVVGTATAEGRNGITQLSRNQLNSIVRTATNSYANEARALMFKENSDFFTEEVFVATLDSRTTPVCRSLDGKRFPIGEGPRPPLHINCRSLRVAYLDMDLIGERPASNFTTKQLLREFSDARGIKAPKSRADLPFGMKGDYDKFARGRMRELTGIIPAKVTYAEWISGQSAQLQNDIMGPTRARIFRAQLRKGVAPGKVLERFVDYNTFQQVTLRDLYARSKDLFDAAGINLN